MSRGPWLARGAGTALAGLLVSAHAHAQFATAQSATAPPHAAQRYTTPSAPATGGFLTGADDCAAPHTQLPPGDVTGAPFVTGTTGTAGQNEPLCYAFWTRGIDADVWFDWSATVSGVVELSFCGATTVDTKAAAWPGTLGCPSDGTALACNEDGCFLQSRMTFPASVGATYTLQVGTFPGAAGGSGAFDLRQITPPPCALYDDGVSENGIGLTPGGELMWMHRQQCLVAVDRLETAYGTATAPGSATNGVGSRVCLWEDSDCDLVPTTGTGAPLVNIQTVVVNAATDVLNAFPVQPPIVIASGCSWIGASANHQAGEFPGPMDQTNPTPAAWLVGSTTAPGTLDVNDLGNNNAGPIEAGLAGFPTAFLLRASGTAAPDTGPGTPVCFGDGSGTPCPCGNAGAAGRGCGNSVPMSPGAWLRLVGTASVGLGATTVAEAYDAAPAQPGLFFQGDQTTNGGAGLAFGDGLRCCGQGLVRLEVAVTNGIGAASTTVSLPEVARLQAGDARCYQLWYRDPTGSPCGTGFNLTNAYELTWLP